MTQKSFISAYQINSNKIKHLYIEDGVKKEELVVFRPFLGMHSIKGEETSWKDIYGKPVKVRVFNSISEMRLWKKENDVGLDILGDINPVIQFLATQYRHDIPIQKSAMCIYNIDIEVYVKKNEDGSGGGFPHAKLAQHPINAITIHEMVSDTYTVLAFGGTYTDKRTNVKFIECVDERHLITEFISLFESKPPDIITGWNCIPINQSVWGSNSISPIKSINNKLFDSKIVAKSPISSKEIYTIEFASGQKIETSSDHKIPVRLIPFQNYTNLSPSPKCKFTSKDLSVRDISNLMNDKCIFVEVPLRTNNNINTEYTVEQCYLLGLIYTDGSLKNKNKINDGFVIYQSDLQVLRSLDDCGVTAGIIGPYTNNYSRGIKYSLISNCYHLIYDNNLKKLNINGLSKLSYQQFMAFLSGLLDGDGFVSGNTYGFCNYNNDIPALQELCQWNGIFVLANLKNSVCRFVDINNDDLTLRKVSRWNGFVPSNLNRNTQQKAKDIRFKKVRDSYWVRIETIHKTGEYTDMMDIETDTNLFVSKGIRVHNCKTFDIPYLVNRINRTAGPEMVKRLSRDGVVKQRESKNSMGGVDITFQLQGHIIWDYIELYKKYCLEPRESYSLNFISRYELGEEKVDYSEFEDLNELYEQDFQKFIEYNIKDTTLVRDLDNKLSFVDLALKVMYTARCTPEAIFGTVQPWDCIIYNELLKRKILCPPDNHHTKQKFPGGYVHPPTPGLYDWVMVYDIVSSYPNQIRSFNLSPETVLSDKDTPEELKRLGEKYRYIQNEDENTDLDICPTRSLDLMAGIEKTLQKYNVCMGANGHFFRKDVEGIVASIYSRVFKERVRLKKLAKEMKKNNDPSARGYDLAQNALKILLNSGYGAMSNEHFRYFDIRLAAAITTNGQTCARGVAVYLEKEIPLIKRIYGDTDSIFMDFTQVVNKRFGDNKPSKADILDFILKFNDKVVQPKIEEFFGKLAVTMNMRELTIVMEPECIADGSIHTAKKRYAMAKVWDEGTFHLDKPKLKVRGIEIVRTSSPQWVRDALKQAVDLIFQTKSNEVLMDYIDKTKKEFFKQPFNVIARNSSVTFSEYKLNSKGLPIAVRAAFKYNQFLKDYNLTNEYQAVGDGDKIKYCAIIEPNLIKSNVIGFVGRLPDELDKIIRIDYNEQFTKTFMAPINKIFEAIKWKTEITADLSDFFGD